MGPILRGIDLTEISRSPSHARRNVATLEPAGMEPTSRDMEGRREGRRSQSSPDPKTNRDNRRGRPRRDEEEEGMRTR